MTIKYLDSKRISALSSDLQPTPESTATYQVTDTSGGEVLHSAVRTTSSEAIKSGSVLIGKTVSKVEFALGKSGSPTGTVTAGVFNSSGVLLYTFGTIDVSTISTSTSPYVWYAFENTVSTYTLSQDEYVGVRYSGGDSSNWIVARHDDVSPPFDGTTSVWSRGYDNGNWQDFTGIDASFKLYLATDGSKPTNVQDNSILVEKDTGRRYWFDADSSNYTQYGWAVDSTVRIQTAGASASLPSTGTFTWSFWYRPNSISAEHYLFNKMGSQTNEYSPRLYLQTTGALKATSTTNNVGYGGQAITSNTMTTGSWNHVIVKQTGSTIYAILNDGAVASASVISGNNSGEDYQFFLDATGVDGDIKNAILYSTALSASDITALYNSGVPATSSTAGVTSNILIEHIFDSSVSITSAANTGSLGGSASVISGTASVVGTPATWTMEPTFRDEYTGGWTTNSGTGVAVSGGEVTWNIAGNQSNQISKAIGSTLSDTAWVAQFEVELSAYSSGEANIVALSSGTSVQSQSSTDNSIICGFGDVGRYVVWVRTGNGTDYSNLGSIDRPANGTRHYITLIRTSSTEVKLYVRTGSHTGSQVANSPQTITTQISNVTGLSNVLHGGWNTGNSGRTLTMVGDNLKIYNGVTTIN